MADVEKPEQPQTNGIENGLDEDEKMKLRPADIEADVKEMERRKRVEMIMSSKLFREELERIIELQMKDGNGPAGLLQQISDMMGIQSGKLHTTHMFRGSNCVTPINDIRGVESMGYDKGEKNLRCKLASVFRLMDLYGWSQGINNQITARLNQDAEHFLVNPHGMLFNEITASSLVKVDMQGNIVEPGTTNFTVHTQGFLLHSAIHASRPDVNCVIHIKTPSVLAISSLKCGLLPLCQEALVIGEVSQHPFLCGIFEPEEREKIIRNLGPHNKVLLLHNHGAICCGATVEEAFYNVYNTVLACETQVKLMPIGIDNLVLVNDETRKQVYDAAHKAPEATASGDKKAKQFRVGELEFEALIRMLDNAGFRTGYIYRHPLVKGDLPKPKNDVEVPPAVSSLGYLIEQEELYKQGNWKKYIDGRNRLDRTKWLNSPNVYQKVEILETGTSDPKKITKWVDQNSEEWVAESSPTHSSTPVKIDSALQFVPKGTNPKEFKKLQQQIKENRRADKITSGPQSHILEGVSWEDAKKLQDANITQTGDQVILVGAASKGIIQRNYQHHALVYKTPYAKNPFDSMSDKEIEDYKQLVERKQRGDTDYEESQSESEAISSSRQDALRHLKSPLLSPQSATSETEEESRDEPRVLRIETKTAPRPIQAEVVLSDAESDSTDARVERSHSARYPKAEKPESVNLMNSFRKSWSLKREKDKNKDTDNPEAYVTRNLHQSLILNDCEKERTDALHHCIARIKQLTHKPVIVDVQPDTLKPLLKSASDPSNLSTNPDEHDEKSSLPKMTKDLNTSFSCNNIDNMSELQKRLNTRKKLLHSAKMKFLGLNGEGNGKSEVPDLSKTSPMCALISEIRETLSEIMSPEKYRKAEKSVDEFFSLRWIERPTFKTKLSDSDSNLTRQLGKDETKSRVSLSKSFQSFIDKDSSFTKHESIQPESLSDFKKDFQILLSDEFKSDEITDNSTEKESLNCTCAIHGNKIDKSSENFKVDENQNEEECLQNFPPEMKTFSDEEATYTVTDDSLLQTYSFTETTETEWYYEKTILKPENSQTVVEIKEPALKENLEVSAVKHTDTGIDTDFTSEKENKSYNSGKHKETETAEDFDIPVCESSGLNKSSETDSSLLKSSSGRTSNDVDTSFAFKTETENSEKTNEKILTPNKNFEEKHKFLEDMLEKTKDESSDSGEPNQNEGESLEGSKSNRMEGTQKLPGIPESPEFTNIDTEDAPVTSSSKDTSPEVIENNAMLTDDLLETTKDPEVDVSENDFPKAERKKKKNNMKSSKRSSTKITVKKELKEKNCDEPVVSEIKLTIKNSNVCQSEKYEVKIQDVTNTSEEMSRSVSSVGENIETFESFEVVDSVCDCDAQQNLEDLQEEVFCAIEKLHNVEEYFEDEIKKQSDVESTKKNGGELFIEYNYREYEEVMNDSRDEVEILTVQEYKEKEGKEENMKFFVSSLLDNICGEVVIEDCSQEVCGRFFETLELETQPSEILTNNEITVLTENNQINLVAENELQTSGTILGFWETKNEDSKPENKENVILESSWVDEGGIVKRNIITSESGEVLEKTDEFADESEKESESLENMVKKELEKSGVNFPWLSGVNEPTNTENPVLEEIVSNQHNVVDKDMTDTKETEDLWKTDILIQEIAGEDLLKTQIQEVIVQLNESCVEATSELLQEQNLLNSELELDCLVFNQTKDEENQVEGFKNLLDTNFTCDQGNLVEKSHATKKDGNLEDLNAVQEKVGEVEMIETEMENKLQEPKAEFFSCEITTYRDNENFILETLGEDASVAEASEDLKETDIEIQQRNDETNMNLSDFVEMKNKKNEEKSNDLKSTLDEISNSAEIIEDFKIILNQIEKTNEVTNRKGEIPENLEGNKTERLQAEFSGFEETKNEKTPEADLLYDKNILEEKEMREHFSNENNVVGEEGIETKIEILIENEFKKTEDDDEEFQDMKNTDNETLSKRFSSNEVIACEQSLIDGGLDEDATCLCVEKESGGNLKEESLKKHEGIEEAEDEANMEPDNVTKSWLNPDASCFVPVFSFGKEFENPGEGYAENMLHKVEKNETKSEPVDVKQEARQVECRLPGDALGGGDCIGEDMAKFTQPNYQIVDQFRETEHENIQFLQILKYIRKKQSRKAITWHSEEFPRNIKLEGIEPVEYVLNCLLNSVTKEVVPTVNDVINFMLTSEESPIDSLAEFEDLENIFSTSNSVVADLIDSVESQMEGDVESLPDEEDLREKDDLKVPVKKQKKKDAIFKVTIATPSTKEIFINYSEDNSSTFNISDLELCNSYIKTDDVNEDFENLSSDNPDFFSIVGSPGKASLNSSFGSATSAMDTFVTPDQFCCIDCDSSALIKSPRSLAIIQEVDEGDNSNSSESENTINGDHSDAHQSTFSHSSKEGSPTKDRSMEDSPKKDKKKKKGLRTPSFLKKKKEKKKIAESA